MLCFIANQYIPAFTQVDIHICCLVKEKMLRFYLNVAQNFNYFLISL